jgi:N-acetylneuraminate synthase/N,N'-diacetyllegionaminate synthase
MEPVIVHRHRIGYGNPCFVIAEAGVNHNGDLNLAKKLIEVAAEAGADYVKFQTFKAEKSISKSAKKAEYQAVNTNSCDDKQLDMVKKFELTKEQHQILINYCSEKNIGFLSTPFDLESVDLLDELGVTYFKIPSGDITNLPLLRKIASKSKPAFLSTGMANLGEIEAALEILENAGLKRSSITILHCNTQYPTPIEDVNLRAMNTIAQAFGLKVGYSDHTLGIEAPIAAVALGASVIEKHFTLDRNLPGPDHKASLEPEELKAMVQGIRNIEKTLGSPIKKPSPSEKPNIAVVRKSIHLAKSLNEGDVLELQDIIMLRPGDGISPMMLEQVIGLSLKKDLPEGQMLRWEDIA